MFVGWKKLLFYFPQTTQQAESDSAPVKGWCFPPYRFQRLPDTLLPTIDFYSAEICAKPMKEELHLLFVASHSSECFGIQNPLYFCLIYF